MKDKKWILHLKNRIGHFLMDKTVRVDVSGVIWKKKAFKWFLSLIHKSYFPVVNFEIYENEITRNINSHIVLESDRIGVAGMIQYYDDNEINPRILEVSLPDLRLLRFDNCYIRGCSDVVVDLQSDCVISEACYNKLPEVELIDGLLYRSSNNLCVLRDNFKNIENIPAGIMMSGKLAHNYYHQIYENLIRIPLLNKCELPESIPLLVDDIVFSVPSFKKIFEILFASVPKRPIITIKSEQMYKVSVLYKFDNINRLTSHLNKIWKSRPEDFVYDKVYCNLLRETLLEKRADGSFPKRIFITRSKMAGRHCNEDDIFGVLKPYGFEIVAPQEYTFEQQMSLFANAEWIVGSTGAAMSNLLFCKPNCKIICLGVCRKYYEPCVFNTIAYISGCKMWYVAPVDDNQSRGFHSDFQVDVEAFASRIKELIAEEL